MNRNYLSHPNSEQLAINQPWKFDPSLSDTAGFVGYLKASWIIYSGSATRSALFSVSLRPSAENKRLLDFHIARKLEMTVCPRSSTVTAFSPHVSSRI